MPNRILRDGILDSVAVNSLSDEGEILYRRLMSVVDDYGRFEANISMVRARCFPLQLQRWSEDRVSRALCEIADMKTDEGCTLVVLYTVGRKQYLQVNNFNQRIRTDRKGEPTPSKYPEPPAAATRRDTLRHAAQGGDTPRVAASGGASAPKAEAYALAETKAEASAKRAPTTTVTPIRESLPALDYHAEYDAMYGNHPVPGYKNEGQVRYLEIVSSSVNPETVARAIQKKHDEWVAFWKANPAEYRPGIGKWFEDEYYLRSPKQARASLSKHRPFSWEPSDVQSTPAEEIAALRDLIEHPDQYEGTADDVARWREQLTALESQQGGAM